jgi:hypothetical protein
MTALETAHLVCDRRGRVFLSDLPATVRDELVRDGHATIESPFLVLTRRPWVRNYHAGRTAVRSAA